MSVRNCKVSFCPPQLMLFLLLLIQCFEGLKAFYGVDGKIRLFRPLENMKRMNSSAAAASLPVS